MECLNNFIITLLSFRPGFGGAGKKLDIHENLALY